MHKSPFRKREKLENGHEITIRPLTAMDYLDDGQIPDLQQPGEDEPLDDIKDMTAEEYKALVDSSKRMVLAGLVAYHNDGNDFRVVDKQPFDCAENELSIYEIEQTAFNEIMRIIAGDSGAPATNRFRGEPDVDSDSGSDGSEIREDPGTDIE